MLVQSAASNENVGMDLLRFVGGPRPLRLGAEMIDSVAAARPSMDCAVSSMCITQIRLSLCRSSSAILDLHDATFSAKVTEDHYRQRSEVVKCCDTSRSVRACVTFSIVLLRAACEVK